MKTLCHHVSAFRLFLTDYCVMNRKKLTFGQTVLIQNLFSKTDSSIFEN